MKTIRSRHTLTVLKPVLGHPQGRERAQGEAVLSPGAGSRALFSADPGPFPVTGWRTARSLKRDGRDRNREPRG